jgi:anaerobic magnesium-protoporphyrin IX monomethyl ester cyclase
MKSRNNFVLLAYANASPFPYHAWTPLAILSLGAYLEQHDIEVEYFDERIHKKERFTELVARRPLLIGLSTMTCFQIKNTLRLARLARRINPDIPLVWGGTHPSMMAEQTLESELVDFVVKGEGEQTLLELVRALQNGKKDFSAIQGLGWKGNGKNILNEDRDFLNIEDLPFPYDGKGKEIILEYMRRSTDTLENIGYESSRGCPHKCGFCYNVFFHKNVCRVKSLEKVRAELLKLKGLGVNKLTFYDDTFLAGKKDLMLNILDLLKEVEFKWIANVRINTFTPELIRKFKEGGCVYLFFGVESPDDDVLKFIRKGQNRRMIDEGIKVAAQGDIPTLYSLMIGLPGETEEQMNRTLDFADEIRRRHPGAEVPIQPYVPLPGTLLYQEAVNYGFKPPTHLEGWKNFTNDEVRNPWIKNPRLLNAIYINSFLAFRYDRFLKNFWSRIVFGPLHRLSLWRWKNRNYTCFIELYLYLTYKRLGRFFIWLEKLIKNK